MLSKVRVRSSKFQRFRFHDKLFWPFHILQYQPRDMNSFLLQSTGRDYIKMMKQQQSYHQPTTEAAAEMDKLAATLVRVLSVFKQTRCFFWIWWLWRFRELLDLSLRGLPCWRQACENRVQPHWLIDTDIRRLTNVCNFAGNCVEGVSLSARSSIIGVADPKSPFVEGNTSWSRDRRDTWTSKPTSMPRSCDRTHQRCLHP